MNELLLNQTLDAFNLSLNPTISREERQKVEEFIYQLRLSPECFEILIHILNNNHSNDSIQMFALTILNDWIKGLYNKIADSIKVTIRQSLLSLITSSVCIINNKVLRTKLAVIISNIAIRQFPTHWPTFLDDLVGILHNSNIEQQEIIFMIIEFTLIDCVDSDFSCDIPTLRKQDILTGFTKNLSPLLEVSMKFYNHYITEYIANTDNTKVIDIVNSILHMIIPLINFSKPNEACLPQHDFSVESFKMLNITSFQQSSIDIIYELAQKDKLSEELFVYLVQQFTCNPLTVLPDDLEDQIIIQKKYSETVFSLFSQNISIATNPIFLAQPSVNIQHILGTYVMILLKIIDHPSRRLVVDALSCWLKIFRNENIKNLPWMNDVACQVLQIYNSKLKQHDGDDSVFYIDFSDIDDWKDFINNFRSQLRVLTQNICQIYPETMPAFLLKNIQRLLLYTNEIYNTANSDKKELMEQWESFHLIFDSVMKEFKITEIKNDYEVILINVIELLQSWDIPITESFLSIIKLKYLQSSASILSISFAHLQRSFSIAFENFGDLTVAESTIDDKFNVRLKASNFLSYICENCSNSIVSSPFTTELITQFEYFLFSKDIFLCDATKLKIRESIVSLSNKINDKSVQERLLFISLKDIVESFTSSSIEIIFSSPQLLIQSISESITTESVSSIKYIRTVLRDLISVIKLIQSPVVSVDFWKPNSTSTFDNLTSEFPFSKVWSIILPNIVLAVCTIHELWNPIILNQFSENSNENTIVLHNIIYNSHTLFENSAPSPINLKILNTSKDFLDIRIFLYQLLALSSSHKILYYVDYHKNFLDNISSSVNYLDILQLSTFTTHFVEPYILNSPVAVYDDVSLFLSNYITRSTDRLLLVWDLNSNITTPWNNESDELLEKIKVDITRIYCDFISSLYCLRGPLAIKSNKNIAMTNMELEELPIRRESITYLILNSRFEFLTKNIIDSIFIILKIPLSISLQKAIQICDSTLEKSIHDSRLLSPIGTDMFSSILQILLKNDTWSKGCENECIELLNSIYSRPDIVDYSKQVLISFRGITVQHVMELDDSINKCGTKKKKKDTFKDFIVEMINIFKLDDHNTKSSIQNIEKKEYKKKNKQKISILDSESDSFSILPEDF